MITILCSSALGVLYYKFSISRRNYSSGKNGNAGRFYCCREKVYEIAEHLRQEKLINSAALFKIYVRLNNFSGKLQAGAINSEKPVSG